MSLRQTGRVQAEERTSGLGPEQKAELNQGWELVGMLQGWSSLSVCTRTRKVGEMSTGVVLEDDAAQQNRLVEQTGKRKKARTLRENKEKNIHSVAVCYGHFVNLK